MRSEDLLQILKSYWGYSSFRPRQEEIALHVLSNKDAVAILPTGGGKSLCFQVPALAREGICLVVSPLIALMKDQVQNLKKRSVPALLIHSGMGRQDVIRVLKNAQDPYFKFLYLSPERLETSLFLDYLPSLNINLIAVDESHCVSQWGYDFRPSYLRIAKLRDELPDIPVLALTASATPAVQQDIIEKLSLKDPLFFRQSFSRPNLSYSVFKADSKRARLTEIISKVPGSGIVYCKSRKRTVEIAELLKLQGISATNYHAGLGGEERERRQEQWIKGEVRIMVCTNAFGMGIDKPDVRLVVHADVPDSLENYYQEAGRAGRDGEKSYAVLLYNDADLKELSLLHLHRFPNLEKIRAVYNSLVNFLQIPVHSGQDQSFAFDFTAFTRNFKLDSTSTLFALKALESDGWIDYNERSFSPSTFVFTANKRALEEFQKAHQEESSLVLSLLRSYEGILDYPAFISEYSLAKQLRLEESVVREKLKRLSAFGMGEYKPQNDQPQIIFTKGRVAAQDLNFKLLPYYQRRDAFVERIKKMIGYTSLSGCRSRYINDYFGEIEERDCGVCDNCLKNKKKELTTEEFQQFSEEFLSKLKEGPLKAEVLLGHFRMLKRETAWEVIRFLEKEGVVRIDSLGRLKIV